MHTPFKINVQNVYQFISTFRVHISTDGRQEFWDGYVGSHNWVQYPFNSEICYAFEAVKERVDTG
jgi:hypothetical protein